MKDGVPLRGLYHRDSRSSFQPTLGCNSDTKAEVLAAFHAAPRIAFLSAAEGIVALNSTIEMMSDLGRPRGDMWEVGLWEDSLTVKGNEVFYN
jgi:glyceraldehyde-3-phosphate dehydrogenase (NAD(P))